MTRLNHHLHTLLEVLSYTAYVASTTNNAEDAAIAQVLRDLKLVAGALVTERYLYDNDETTPHARGIAADAAVAELLAPITSSLAALHRLHTPFDLGADAVGAVRRKTAGYHVKWSECTGESLLRTDFPEYWRCMKNKGFPYGGGSLAAGTPCMQDASGACTHRIRVRPE